MTSLRPNLKAFLGAALGAIAGLIAMLLGNASSVGTPFTVVVVLAIALVGFDLGAGPALYAYTTASLTMILGNAVPGTGAPLPEIIRFGVFVVGSPFVILLALRAERGRAELMRARTTSSGIQRRLEEERKLADGARREMDAVARRSEQDRARLAEVAEVIPEPLIVYAADGTGSYANRAALRLFGRSFVDRPVAEWGTTTDPRDERGVALTEAEYPQVAAQSQALRRRMIVRVPMSGRDLLIDVEGTPIPGGGAVLLLRDVGKEEDERRRLSRFASFVSHELRNPLAVARARIELAQREAPEPHRSSTHAARALESVEAAIAVLERLEMYSRADSGMVEATREAFEPRVALEAAVERLRTRGSDRPIKIRSSGRVAALGDQRLTEQAITNLLTNADRYSEADQPVHVTIEVAGDQVVLRVADAGPGISDEVAERLFRDRLAVGRGLGLGLYLTNAMMEAQGGTIQLEQRRPGATFALRWSQAAAHRNVSADAQKETKANPGVDEAEIAARG